MSVKKENYKVVEVKDGSVSIYVVKKRILGFFWVTVKDNKGLKIFYTSKRSAQAYINFLK